MKNTLKILILILSVALVIGALVMAVGAEEQKDGYVSLKIGDVTFPDMTLDEALAKIVAVNHTVIKDGEENVYTEVIGDETITISNPKQIYAYITLLGNVKQTVKYENKDFDYNGDGVAESNGRTSLYIYPNGYEYDIATTNAFNTQRSSKNVRFEGEGSIKLSAAEKHFYSNSGSSFYFIGKGRGIRIYSDLLIKDFTNYSGSGGLYEFRNCDFDINTTLDTNNSGQIFKVETNTPSGAYLNMYDCTMDIGIGLDLTQEDIDAKRYSMSGYFLFNIANVGHVYIENTYITTDGSGLTCTGTGAAASSACPTGNGVSFKMVNSKLVCAPDHPVTVASGKAFGKNDIAYTNLITGTGKSTGDIVFKDSYASATFRIIEGSGNDKNGYMTEEQSKIARILTFDNSTVEVERSPFDAMGMQWAKSGQGLFAHVSYANFINGSRIILNGTGLSTGGGSDKWTKNDSYQPGANGTNTTTGTDAHTIDLAEGTRLSKIDVGNVDLPAGCTLVEDKTGDLECPYVVKKSTDKVLSGNINSYSITRGIGFYENNVSFAGRNGVHIWTLPTSTDTGYSNNVSATFADGKIAIANSSYPNINGEDFEIGGNSPYSVIVYQFDFMTFDNTIPLKITFNGTASATRQIELFKITENGESNKGAGVAPGKWNTYMTVLDTATRNTFTYLNGELVLERAFDSDVKSVKEMRIELGIGTYPEGGKIAFSNIRKVAMDKGDYLDSTNGVTVDNAKLYLEHFAYPEANSNVVSPIMVGNTAYDSLNEALTAAQANNSHVTLYQDYKIAEVVTAWGWVNTNGFKMDKVTSELETEAYEGGIRFIKPTYIDLHFYTGVADDPAADTDNIKTYTYIKNGKFSIPNDIKVENIVLDDGLLYASGWLKGEYINPGAYSTAAAYLEAVKGKTPIDAATEAVLEEATYYPVYSYAAYTVTVGNSLSYYGSNVELADAINENLTDSVKVKLYTDLEASKSQAAGPINNTYLRKAVSIDLNGNRFTYQSNSPFMYGASGGDMAVYSSKAGGELVHIGTSKTDVSSAVKVTNAMFSMTQTATLTIGEVGAASADNLTVYSANLLNQAAGSTATDAVQINGGTYVKLGASKEAMFNFGKKNYELEIKNAIFVDASAVSQGESEGADKIFALKENVTLNLTECNVIANGGKAQFMSLSDGDVVNLTGCKIAGTLASSVGEIILDNATSAYMTVGDNVKAKDESKILTNANTKWSDETVTYRVVRPVVGSVGADLSSYVYVTNDPEFEAKDAYKIILIPDMNIMPVAKAECTEYSWCDLSSEVFMKTYVRTGDDPLDFAHLITPLVPTEAMETLVLGATERWTLWGETTLIPGKQVVGTVSDFKGYVDLTLGSSIGIYFYVAEENYSVLDADTKAMFSENAITIGGADYRMAKNVKYVKANEAFSDAVYEITLKEKGYSYKLTYSISLYDYIAKTFATEGLDASAYKLAYYLGEYLADVYGAFDTEDNEDGAAIIAALVASNSSYAESGDIILPEYATNMGSAAGKIDIKVDLSASPTYVITSSVDGKVNWCGAEVQLLAGVAVRLSAEACDFDNVMTFSLSDGSIGSYCYGDYVEGVAGDASASEVAKSFYNYITFAEGYRK